ncbi:GntR family transcriptional regulator [Longispora fulva]|uniref:DNA-binding GntR family transcriptional regulator n=1 Tax=Longispora fulva TaxID=619741 RepID=A0A8J7GSQ1_9ACTN|nr:GntR family transcriptional regulator [Longispora fulva]MBG6136366.1 DNA-binding GntR family transcriptional regulator [Longispora fulva]
MARLPVAQRSVLADEVYQILKEGLLSHRIGPGSRLNLDQLARELHVSNTPVRQALARLEFDGLVTKLPYRGFVASPLLDSRVIAELYDFRLMIEPTSAARAARRHQEADIAHLEALCDPDDIARLADDIDAIGQRDTDFHCSIALHAGNSVVCEYITTALARMRNYSLYNRHKAGEQAWEEHAAIVVAIRAGDPDAAATAMRTHLTNSRERMSTAFD